MQMLAAVLVQLGSGGKQVITLYLLVLVLVRPYIPCVGCLCTAMSAPILPSTKPSAFSRLCDMFFGSGCCY